MSVEQIEVTSPSVQGQVSGTCYQVSGEGPPLILVHGLGLNHQMWQWQRDALAAEFTVITYDLLAMRYLPYARIYPFAEGGSGVLMIAGALNFISIPIALFIGGLGAISVIKAVYVDKRDLRCACVGGNSNVPLGFVSLIENVMMVLMAIWMIMK